MREFPPDEYLIIYNYEDCQFNKYYFSIITDRYLIDKEIPFSKEINSAEFSSLLFSHTKKLVIDLNSYNIKPYIILANSDSHLYYCSQYKDINDILNKQKIIYYQQLKHDFHIVNFDDISCPNEEPYIILLLSNTIFELITDYRIIKENKNITIPSINETIVFDIKAHNNEEEYIFAFSNNENLQDLDKTKIDNTNILFSKSTYYQFKLNNNNQIETELKIRLFECKEGIEISTIKENQISDLFIQNYDKDITIKYYINLLKKDSIFYHYELYGETEVFLLKDEISINDSLIEKILASDVIPEDIFSLKKNNLIKIKPYQILGIKYKFKKIVQYLYMSSLYQDFTIFNPIKYIKAYNSYVLKKGVKVVLENNTTAEIKLSTYDNKENYILNQTFNSFDNSDNNLILESNEDTIVYLFYKRINGLNLETSIFLRDLPNNTILLLEKVTNDTYSEVYYDYTFDDAYQSRSNEINKINTKDNYIIFDYPYTNYQSLLNLELHIYSDMKRNYYTLNKIDYGYNVLKHDDNDDNYISQIIYNNEDKQYLYYQYINCENNIDNNEEIFVILDNKNKIKIQHTSGDIIYINRVSQLFFIYNTYLTSIFNFFLSKNNYQYSKNDELNFSINFNSRNEIIINLKSMYINKDVEHYFIYTIINLELNDTLPPLNNICYAKELVDKYDNSFNIFISKKVLSGEQYQNVSLNTSERLEDNYTLYINVFVKEYMSDEFNNYFIYNAKFHKINSSDFPEKKIPNQEAGDDEISTSYLDLIITFSIIGGIVLIVLIFLLYRYINKKKKLSNESMIYKENSGEIMLKSESDDH